MTNGPGCEGSPEITAICAPGGKLGGAGPHLIEAGASALKMSCATIHTLFTFRQAVTYLPFSELPPIIDSNVPAVTARSPPAPTSALVGVHLSEKPGAAIIWAVIS